MDIHDCPDDDNSSEPTFKESVGLPWSIGGDMATNDIFGRLGRILCSADDAYLNLHNFVEGRGVMLNAMLATFFSDPCSAGIFISFLYARLRFIGFFKLYFLNFGEFRFVDSLYFVICFAYYILVFSSP